MMAGLVGGLCVGACVPLKGKLPSTPSLNHVHESSLESQTLDSLGSEEWAREQSRW